MTRDERLERLEKALSSWLKPDRTTMVMRELRATGAPIGPNGLTVWIDCTRAQAKAYDQKRAELRGRGFGDVLDGFGPSLTVVLPDEVEPNEQVPPLGGSEQAQASADTSEITSLTGNSPGEAG